MVRPVAREFGLGRAEGATKTVGGLGGAVSPSTGPGQSPGGGLRNYTVLRVLKKIKIIRIKHL